MAEGAGADLSPATYAELYELEDTFESIDAIATAFQASLSHDAYEKRAALASRIPNFWPLVFEQAPPEVDQYILPSDSNVLTGYLTSFSVERFESKNSPEIFASLLRGSKNDIDDEAIGEPRSVSLRFEFKENEYFEDRVLEKSFWFRRSIEGEGDDPDIWSGRVSKPVKIHWKDGQDLSDGMTDAACALWDAQEKANLLAPRDLADAKAKAEEIKKLPEYKYLMEKVDNSVEGSQSFFTWFGYHGPWISTAQDKQARALEKSQKRTQAKRFKEEQSDSGAKEGDDDDDVEDLSEMPTHLAVEVFPDGEELALALAEDVWPNAIKQFIEAQEGGDLDDMSIGSFSEGDLEDLDEEQIAQENLEEIKGLAGRHKRGDEDAPPAKRQKS